MKYVPLQNVLLRTTWAQAIQQAWVKEMSARRDYVQIDYRTDQTALNVLFWLPPWLGKNED